VIFGSHPCLLKYIAKRRNLTPSSGPPADVNMRICEWTQTQARTYPNATFDAVYWTVLFLPLEFVLAIWGVESELQHVALKVKTVSQDQEYQQDDSLTVNPRSRRRTRYITKGPFSFQEAECEHSREEEEENSRNIVLHAGDSLNEHGRELSLVPRNLYCCQ
jgi:hypothetical protein